MTAGTMTTTAPEPVGRLGTPMAARDALDYLSALGQWRDQRRAELDRLDEAALASPERDALTGDVQLSMALWKSVADRYELLVTTWDSGRAGVAERERLSSLIWGRLDATVDPRLAGQTVTGAALSVSLPEACRLSDALAAALRTRLSLDPVEADLAARLRALRAQLERVRELVDGDRSASLEDGVVRRVAKLDAAVTDLVGDAGRGADVGGRLPVVEGDAARLERDLIVAAATRHRAARDAARARAQRAELEARGQVLRALAERCVRELTPAPRLAVPDVAALGPVPTEAAAVEAYLARLEAVGRALDLAHTAYQSALDERDELRGRLEAYGAKAGGAGLDAEAAGDLAELRRRAVDELGTAPASLERARALVAAYQAYLASHVTGGTP